MLDVISDLKDFYNSQANKFHSTRKKTWVEFDEMLKVIKQSKKRNIKILELWCWDGRFLQYLSSNTKKNIDYTWVDISDNLISIAREENPWWNFVVDDMASFLQLQSQQHYDFIIAVASFQHISTYKERLLVLKNIYRTLNYGWSLIMTNWSFSNWFINKYKYPILKSFIKAIITLWIYKYNDIYVPWLNDGMLFYRYYHIFTIWELRKLLNLSWFVINQDDYISPRWVLSKNWKTSRNSLFVAQKEIY